MHVQDQTFYFRIVGRDEKYNSQTLKVWEGFRFTTFNKYMWYFRYRAALFQILHPRWKIDTFWGGKPIPRRGHNIKHLKGKIAARKAHLTKYKNILYNLKANWCEIFPIEENPRYINSINKINSSALELKRLENEYEALISQANG